MFKKLFCKHEYKYYNTKAIDSLLINYGYNVFQFVCPKCGRKAKVNQLDICDKISKYESIYNKAIVLGKEPIESSKLSIPRYMNIGICYESPAVTMVLEKYLKRGIDLLEIDY